jgi:hypothetical protein
MLPFGFLQKLFHGSASSLDVDGTSIFSLFCLGFLSFGRSMLEILFSIGDAPPYLVLMLVWVKVNTARSSESHYTLGTLLSDSPS